MEIFIPAIGSKDSKYFEVQCISIIDEIDEISITGKIGSEIIDSVNLSTSIILFDALNLKHQINKIRVHFHFTHSIFCKDGYSADLGIFLSLISSFGWGLKNYKLLVTGGIDLFGNVSSVGCIDEKFELFNNEDFDYFIGSASHKINNKNYLGIHNVKELFCKDGVKAIFNI